MTAAERSVLPLLVAVLAYGLVVARGGGLLIDGDTYWHIATGNWILQHLAVLHRDPFSFTAAGARWVDHEWLGQVLMALAYDAGGWSGLALLTALALAAALGLLCLYLRRWLAPLPSAILVLLAYFTVLPELLCRPHVLALPMLVVWTAGLVNARADGCAPSWRLVPLMALWANLHGSFAVGLVLAVPLGIEAICAAPARARQAAVAWGGFVIASILAACLTPNLLQGLVHPLRIMRMPVTLAAILEWRSPDFQQMQPLEIWLLVGLVVALSRGVRLPPVRMLLLLALLHAGLQHVRNQLLLGLVGPLVIAQPLAGYFRSDGIWLDTVLRRSALALRIGAAATAAAVTGFLALHPLARVNDRVTPRSAMEHVPPALAPRPVLNAYEFGGYLIFRGLRPYIDGRADMYGDAFVAAFLELSDPRKHKLQAELHDRAIAWTLLRPDDVAVAMLDALPGWRRLYADDTAVVHVRTQPQQPNGIASSAALP